MSEFGRRCPTVHDRSGIQQSLAVTYAYSHVVPGPSGFASVGDFKRAHFKGSSSEAWMNEEKPAGYQMRTTGPDGALGAFPISWVIGGNR